MYFPNSDFVSGNCPPLREAQIAARQPPLPTRKLDIGSTLAVHTKIIRHDLSKLFVKCSFTRARTLSRQTSNSHEIYTRKFEDILRDCCKLCQEDLRRRKTRFSGQCIRRSLPKKIWYAGLSEFDSELSLRDFSYVFENIQASLSGPWVD